MKPSAENKVIFESMPVLKAIEIMALPTIISQIIVLVYNFADTFYVGKTNDPYMVAGISLILPIFNIKNIISQIWECFQDKIKATNLSRYGCEWVAQNPEVRSKIDNTVSKHGGYTYQRSDLQDKIRQTNKLKYGDEVPMRTPEIQAKYQSTMKDRYGASSPLSEGSILKDKIEATNLQKYGSRSPFGAATIRDKNIQTWKDRYNVDNPFKSPAIQDKIKSTLIDTYGVDNPQKSDEIRKKTELTNLIKYGAPNYGASIDRVRQIHSISWVSRAYSLSEKYNGTRYN